MTHPILALLAAYNKRADELSAEMRSVKNTDAATIIRINRERGDLNAAARADGFVRLFDGRFRLSGTQVLKVSP